MGFLDNNNLSRVWNKMKAWVQTQLPTDFNGATTASAGTHGLVPAPGTTDTDKFLRGDGSWADGSTDTKVTQTNTTTDADYRILLSGSADDTEHTEGAGKNLKFTVNPNTSAVTFGTRYMGSQVGAYSFAQGNGVVASGSYSHAEGSYTIASGTQSHAEGSGTTASSGGAHAEGYYTLASSNTAHAEGNSTTAGGQQAHAEGYYTKASGAAAHAEGNSTIASGGCSHAEGGSTTVSAYYGHAEGYQTIASNYYAHAEGHKVLASGTGAHAEGNTTEANHKAQHVFGEYNLVDASTAAASERGTYVEIVGNGTSTARSNARTLDWSGNEVLSGKLTVGAAPTADMDVATKKYVDDTVTAAIAQVLAAQY